MRLGAQSLARVLRVGPIQKGDSMRKSAALLAAIALLLTPAAVAGAAGDSARGHGRQTSQGFELSFSAHSNFNGTEPTGSMRWTNPNTDPNTRIDGRVTCLALTPATTTTPATARIRGVVTSVYPAGTPVGLSFAILATDNGKFSQVDDTSLFNTYSALPPVSDPTCADVPVFTPYTGDVVIVNN
jgi:hypothetical protein